MPNDDLELEKLREEVKSLKVSNAESAKPFYRKTSFWLTAVPAGIAAAFSLANYVDKRTSDLAKYEKEKLDSEIAVQRSTLADVEDLISNLNDDIETKRAVIDQLAVDLR
jgi:hypothetical protein